MSVQKLTQISAEVLYQTITDTQNEGQNTAVVESAESQANGDRLGLSSFFKVHTVILFCSH